MPRNTEPTKDELTELLGLLRKEKPGTEAWNEVIDNCVGAILADRLRAHYFKRDEAKEEENAMRGERDLAPQ